MSGLTKLHLLWLFRNFSILDFSVLSRGQQQMVARMWEQAPKGKGVNALLDLIGCIEGFAPDVQTERQPHREPQLHKQEQPPRPQQEVPMPATMPATAASIANRSRKPAGAWAMLGPSASWTSIAVIALAGGIYLAEMYLRPHVSAAKPTVATQPMAHSQAPPQPLASPATPAVKTAEVNPLPRASSEAASSAAAAHALVPEARVAPPAHLPDAMARRVSVEIVKPTRATSATVRKTRPEVLIRVHVDEHGQTQGMEIMQGDRSRVGAAMAAARRWSFHPCSNSNNCEHVLKFTDDGETSHLHLVD